MQVTKGGIESIKGANPLEAVVAERGIELRRKGRHLVGHCPFHADKKAASFTITPNRGLFHCFGCGGAGAVGHGADLPERERPRPGRALVAVPDREWRAPGPCGGSLPLELLRAEG